MLKIKIITVGKKNDPAFADKIAEYEKRLKPYVDLSWQLIPNSDQSSESEKILKNIKDGEYIILLDERGIMANNSQLVTAVEKLQQNAKDLTIIIGGSYGVDSSVRARANNILSLSKLVLPHQFVRLIVVEQLYRTYSIINNQNYHH